MEALLLLTPSPRSKCEKLPIFYLQIFFSSKRVPRTERISQKRSQKIIWNISSRMAKEENVTRNFSRFLTEFSARQKGNSFIFRRKFNWNFVVLVFIWNKVIWAEKYSLWSYMLGWWTRKKFHVIAKFTGRFKKKVLNFAIFAGTVSSRPLLKKTEYAVRSGPQSWSKSSIKLLFFM